MPRPSCWLTLLLLGLTLSSAVMAQAPPPPPGGGGTPEIKAVSHVATAVVNVEYFLDDDYPGFGGAPELLLFSGGLEMERFEVSGTAGTHDYDVELPVPDGTFVVRIHLDNLAGQPWGISRTFTVKDGVVTLLLSAEYIGTTGIPSTVPVYVCKECARGTFAPQGDSALDTLIPSSLTAIDFGANGGVGACSSCAGGSLPDGSAFTSIQLMPQVFLSRSSFSPGYFSEFDTSIHVFRSDIDGLGAYYTDPSTGQVITFFDQINGSSADGLLEDEHGKYLEARVEESGGGLTTDLTQATKIVLKRRDGLIETFELFDPTDSDAESDKDGKLVSRKDANGNEVVITYGSGWELSQITLPNGDVYQYAYGAQQSGRDTVSGMTLPNGTSVSFSYTDGFLSGVTAGTWQWNCSITQDAIAQTTNYNITSSSGNQTFYLTKDFIELDGSLLNQPVNFLRAIANGNGENVMSLFVNPSDTNQVLVWRGEDSLLLRTLGVSEVHYTSWSVGDPSQGWNAFTNKIPESTYAANGIFQSTRAKLLGSPEDSVDETGVSTVHEYDSDFFLTKRTYSDGTYEEWTYDADHHVTRRRDRAGRVTKFVYDSAGNMTESHRGILDVNGTDVNQPEYAVYRYEYSAAGLITKEKGPLYSAAQPDLQITEYVYGANDRLVEKREAADVSGGARPTTYYTYDAAGRLQTTTDPAGRVTSFTYDNLNRLIQTVYPDNSTEQTLYGAASSGQEGLVVKTKNRRGVVTTYGYDSSARPTWKLAGAATDSNILDGQPDDNPITDLSLQIHTSYQYLPGTSLPETVTVNSQTTSHTYDYRRRQATVTRYPRSGSSLTTSYTFENNRLFSIEDPYGRKEFRGYRVADGVPIRTIRAAEPSYNISGNTAVLNATRSSSPNAQYAIVDSVANAVGQITQIIDERGTVTEMGYDSRARLVRQKSAAGTSVEAVSESDYDLAGNLVEKRSPRYFDASDANGYQAARQTIVYNGRGLALRETDAPGTAIAATTTTTYELDGSIATVTDPQGAVTTSYWQSCCATSSGKKDPYGHGTFENTDAAGNITHQVFVSDRDQHSNPSDPLDAKTFREATRRFDEAGRLIAETIWLVPRGTVDPQAPPIAGLDGIAKSEGITERYLFDNDLSDGVGLDSSGGVTVAKLGGGTFNVSIANFLSQLAFPPASGGASTSFGNGSAGSAAVTVSPEEEISVTVFDGTGRLVGTAALEPHFGQTPNALISWRAATYDQIVTVSGFGDCVEVSQVDPYGSVTKVRQDGLGRALETLDADGNITSAEYDSRGNKLSTANPLGHGITCVYDELNRPTQCTDAVNEVTSQSYDRASNVISEIDAKGNATSIAYDARGRRSQVTDRLSGVTTFQYDGNSNLTQVIDEENQVTAYEYDLRGAQTKVTYPDHVPGTSAGDLGYGIVETVIDEFRRPLRKVDQQGDTVTLDYDLAGRLLQRDYRTRANSPSGTITDSDQFTYDAAGRMLTATSGRYGNVVSLNYDEAGRKASESLTVGGQSYTTSVGFDNVGRHSSMTYPSGALVQRTYTNRGQLYEVKDGGSVIDTRTYDLAGRWSTSTYSSGLVTTRTYRDDNTLASIDMGTVGVYGYSYDANKNLTAETITGPMSPWGFSTGTGGYDLENRLTNWSRTDGNKTQAWTLSLAGDWDSFTENGTAQSRVHGGAHEIASIDGSALAHDAKGNLTENLSGADYTWDFDNKLASADTNGDLVADVVLTYDALGRKVSRASAGATTVFARFGDQIVAEYALGAAPGSPTDRFVYGDYVDEILLSDHATKGKRFFSRSQNYSTVALTDFAATTVKERYAYSSVGELVILDGTGSTILGATAEANHCTYTGRTWDSDLGLYGFRARMYDATLGRFLGRDPLGYVDGSNLYAAYFTVSGVDPTGTLLEKPGYPVKWKEFPGYDTTDWSPRSGENEGGHVFKEWLMNDPERARSFVSKHIDAWKSYVAAIAEAFCIPECLIWSSILSEMIHFAWNDYHSYGASNGPGQLTQATVDYYGANGDQITDIRKLLAEKHGIKISDKRFRDSYILVHLQRLGSVLDAQIEELCLAGKTKRGFLGISGNIQVMAISDEFRDWAGGVNIDCGACDRKSRCKNPMIVKELFGDGLGRLSQTLISMNRENPPATGNFTKEPVYAGKTGQVGPQAALAYLLFEQGVFGCDKNGAFVFSPERAKFER
jgi:RHS repeat-associated protein